ncbi:hypothetical protein [Methanobacterium spitsbergense]|uniref:Portal protein n=1 Tax=Methanobacterium spitsbergense TaxID=2874285 RepID=A0A8T5URB9_9EURY|nr:hypothetical protein [Methanobacterium spitsbergense]MBZ2166308.1 hypothetical protein [Methanobacterium spitsbergense]
MPKDTIPMVFDDPSNDQMRWMQRRYPGYGIYDLKLLENYPTISDFEARLHYERGIAGPFIDLLVLLDIGTGVNLIPTGFESDDDGQEAKKLVEAQFEKMELNETMNRFSAFTEVLGRACNIRTYNGNGGFYFDENDKITGIDCIDPITLDMNSVQKAVYDRTGTQPYIQNVNNSLISWENSSTIELTQDRIDYNIRGNLYKHGPYGVSALQNCLQDCRTAAAAPGLRLELMWKQANVYRHNVLDVEELQKTPMGEDVLKNWDEANKKLAEQVDILRRQEESRKSIVSWSFLKPAEISSMSGKATDFAETEKNTYDVLATKLDIPLVLVNAEAAKTVNRSSMETILNSTIQKREAGGSRKTYRKLIARYAQEIKTQAGIVEGYFKIEYKPFLSKDLLGILQRMQLLWQMGATGKTEIRRSQDMADSIDFGAEDESADYQNLPSDDFEIANVNSHLEEPKNSVAKKQELIQFKKALRKVGLMG